METVVVLNVEGYSVSFKNIIRLIEFWPYGSGMRCAVELLAVTGMRPSELDSIKHSNFWYDTVNDQVCLVWMPGKNQKVPRRETIPNWLAAEIDYYLHHTPREEDKPLFVFKHGNLRHFVNHVVRPALGGDFLLKRPGGPRGTQYGSEFIIQLKSFRHTYACKQFYEAMQEYGQELALHMVGKKMAHKTNMMTARFYCSDINDLKEDLQRFRGATIGDIIKKAGQTKLLAFL